MPDNQVIVIDHPLVQHKLSVLRSKDTNTNDFRNLIREISILMGYEILRDLPMEEVEIETPLEKMKTKMLAGKKLCIVPILRAGTGFLDGLLQLVPLARVGHIGLYRDPETLVPVEYYLKFPEDMSSRRVIVVDPMLATGNSAVAAVERVKDAEATDIKFMCLIAAPQGIKTFHEAHPDIPIYTAAIDRELNDHGYILPGIGDAGDRIFGTK
ncbi:MAG: uracil phosphoribosyltransferase [Alphaproteobacteria bacterium]|nr:MAG: uracil phosphoribosyltransferase [Alphaproteobacteria bacterium]